MDCGGGGGGERGVGGGGLGGGVGVGWHGGGGLRGGKLGSGGDEEMRRMRVRMRNWGMEMRMEGDT